MLSPEGLLQACLLHGVIPQLLGVLGRARHDVLVRPVAALGGFDDEGKATSSPFISVWHNGTQIHDKVELTGPTGSANGSEMKDMGSIMLQDHGNKVRFRNVRFSGF